MSLKHRIHDPIPRVDNITQLQYLRNYYCTVNHAVLQRHYNEPLLLYYPSSFHWQRNSCSQKC